MKTLSLKPMTFILMASVCLLLTTAKGVKAQVKFIAQTFDVKLAGTSSLHDWEMKASKGSSNALIVVNNDKITSISGLNFTLPATALKSDHKLMDNNTYKALNTDANPNISFVLTSANVTPIDGTTYQLKCLGKLTIAGVTHETELLASGKYNASDKSFLVSGSKKFKMTDYNVKPPTVMFGSIKTGDDITVSYNLKFVK